MMLGVSLMLLIDAIWIIVDLMLNDSVKSTFTMSWKLQMAENYFTTFVQVCLCLVLMRIVSVEYYLDKADSRAGQRSSAISGDDSFCYHPN